MNGAAHAGHPEDVDEATKATSSPSSAERDARSGAGTQSGQRYSMRYLALRAAGALIR